MTFQATVAVKSQPDIEDTVFACERCGAEVVRTRFCTHEPALTV